MPNQESITIAKCPLCEREHIYSLAIVRSLIARIPRMRGSEELEARRPVEFTRLFTCPTKNATFQATFTLYETSSDRIESVVIAGVSEDKPSAGSTADKNDVITAQATPLTPHNAALYEAGKKLLLDSVSLGQDFCKFMIGTSNGAIPIYLALLGLIVPKESLFQSWQSAILVLPAFFFLVSGIIFTIGLLPRRGNISLDLPAEIDAERSRVIKHRMRFSAAGVALYCIAVLCAILLYMFYLIVSHRAKIAH